ncbi:MAG: helix-turn-helix domain-containing protein [Ignavibacteriaceae bacterium]
MIQLHYIDVIILISAGQCFFVTVFILHKYGDSLANRMLSVLFFSYTLVLTEMLLWDIKLFTIFPRFMILLVGTAFLVGPLQYLYTIYLSHLNKKFRAKHLLHFIPFLLFELSMIPVLLTPERELIAGLSAGGDGEIPVTSLILNWAIMLQIIIYTVLIIIAVRRYSVKIKNIFSSIEKIRLGWLRNTAVLFSLAIILYIVETSLSIGGLAGNDYAITSIATAGVMYVMGYLVLFKSEVFASHEFNEQIESSIKVEDEKISIREEETGLQPKYEKSGLSSERAADYAALLLKIMHEDKPYLDSELTLNKLAEKISIPSHHLSEVINVQLNQNFFDFVNKYRVEKVKTDLADPQKANYTLLAIAVDAGFNSKSSFNLVFKKQTGITPSEYRKKIFKK